MPIFIFYLHLQWTEILLPPNVSMIIDLGGGIWSKWGADHHGGTFGARRYNKYIFIRK